MSEKASCFSPPEFNDTTYTPMGRIRTKSRKAIVSKTSSTAVSTEEPSIPALLTKAQNLITQCNYELAQKFIRRILERDPRHIDARELLGIAQLETGELEDAKKASEFIANVQFKAHVVLGRRSNPCFRQQTVHRSPHQLISTSPNSAMKIPIWRLSITKQPQASSMAS